MKKNTSDVKRRPLVVVPGLFGSKIKVKQGLCWKQAWPALTLAHLKRLEMNSNGDPVYRSKVTGITGEILGDFCYGPLIKALKKVWTKNKTLFEAPFDWRRDLKKTAALEGHVSGVPSLASRIKYVLSKTGADKIDILSHSQGGLAVLHYLKEDPKRFDHINHCLFLAPGIFGSVMSAKRILYGASFRPSSPKIELRRPAWKKLSSNMIGIYQIFPSRYLYNDVGHFLEINGEAQGFEQSYALGQPDPPITQDTIINISLLQMAGEVREKLDRAMKREDFHHRFRECATIFYGVIPDSTDSRLLLTYPGRDGVPETRECKTAGDGNVVDCCWKLFKLPPGRLCAFPCTTHMGMVQSSTVINAAIDVLQDKQADNECPKINYEW